VSVSIEILSRELSSLEKAKRKSIESYKAGDIDFQTHSLHLKNLFPKINQLKKDIYFLTKREVSRGWFVDNLSKN